MKDTGKKSQTPLRKCPECGTRVIWEGNMYRPFCSSRCKQIDLGKWLREEYSLPVYESPELTEENLENDLIH